MSTLTLWPKGPQEFFFLVLSVVIIVYVVYTHV